MTDLIPQALAGTLAARGYDTLTAVQSAVLAPETDGRDLLVSAQTGSGKTVAFGMAIAPTLLGDADKLERAGKPLALVIAPTRELALQVERELAWLYADAGATLATCVGGMDIRTERRALERGAHIVVGTPGRLRDHITKHALDMSGLRAVVLDEADEMLDLGFREDLEFILGAAPQERRTLMFSATVPKPIAALATEFQHDALRISAAGEEGQHVDIDYKVMVVPAPERENAIINTLLFHEGTNTIVFCHTRESVKHLAARLVNRGFPVVALSGELTQAERTNALNAMRDGRARVCVATDVAARGIDLPNLDLVIHADIPSNPDTLLHRSGRTGRAGRKGTCILIAPAHRRSAVQRVLKMAQLEASDMRVPGVAQIEARYHETILTAPALSEEATPEIAAFAEELLTRYTPAQIAAAYLRQQFATRPAPEDVSDVAPLASGATGKRGERAFEAATPVERFTDGVWFRISVGRKQRAEPRWLLPMICKAGDVTKTAVGSIKIMDNETQFEITAKKVDGFAKALGSGQLEKGIYISRVDQVGEVRPPKEKSSKPNVFEAAENPKYKEAAEAIARPRPKAVANDAAPKPKAAVKAKDKGKPNWAGKKAAWDPAVGETAFKPKAKRAKQAS